MPTSIQWLHRFAFLDGMALLALVLIAVPLKYGLDFPYLVKILGPMHGVLFISLSVTLVWVLIKKHIGAGLAALLFFGALIPGGAFFADYQLRKKFKTLD